MDQKMTKRSKALITALALYRRAVWYEKIVKEEPGIHTFTFWNSNNCNYFTNPKDMKTMANKIARQALGKNETDYG
jgi:hypothetical protein